MEIRELRWLFFAVLAVASLVSLVGEPATLGISEQWTDGEYRFAGGTQPVALIFALVIAVLYRLLMLAPPASLGKSISRRIP
jgi:hypothetical protein